VFQSTILLLFSLKSVPWHYAPSDLSTSICKQMLARLLVRGEET